MQNAQLLEERHTVPKFFGPVPTSPDDAVMSPELQKLIFGHCPDGGNMGVYALIDATLRTEAIGFNDLPYWPVETRCLFTGEAASELRDVAPYIVELSPEPQTIQQALFQSDFFENHFHQGSAIIVRSMLKIDAVLAHFRRFTRIQHEAGAWYFFRFWDPSALRPFMRGNALRSAKTHPFFQADRSMQFLFPEQFDRYYVVCLGLSAGEVDRKFRKLVFDDLDFAHLDSELIETDKIKLVGFLQTLRFFRNENQVYLEKLVERAFKSKQYFNVKSSNGIAWILLLLYLGDRYGDIREKVQRLFAQKTWNFDQIARFFNQRDN